MNLSRIKLGKTERCRPSLPPLIVLSMLLLTSCGSPAGRPGSTDEFVEMRNSMVDNQIVNREINDERVLKAMREVPRHLFVPRDFQAQSYEDYPVPIGSEQSISQPYIVAFMCEALQLKPEDRVLEIGTGSGYSSAVLSRLSGQVYSIEIIEDLGKKAAQTLASLGYNNVHCRIGDGYKGWPDKGPFDAIMVTAAADHIPEALLNQLAPGGRLIVPLGHGWQSLTRITRSRDGKLKHEQLLPVSFVPMTGEVLKKPCGDRCPTPGNLSSFSSKTGAAPGKEK